jgi:hypothetical protein
MQLSRRMTSLLLTQELEEWIGSAFGPPADIIPVEYRTGR